MAIISIYPNVKDTKSTKTVLLNIFLDAVQTGRWQDQVLKIRTIENKDERRAAKALLPNVTISGVFTERTDKSCTAHSGFIAIDIDDLNNEVESTRELLKTDTFVYSIFTSVSGTGLCVIFKIDPEKHREAFEGIADYLIKKYQIIIDPTGINPSRARYVSYDPFLFIRENPITFKKYLPKPKAKKINATIFVKTEFDEVIKQMVDANVSCVEDYRDWRDIAFGLADQFGEGGRNYFHQLSSCSHKYESSMCDKQYTQALKRNNRGGNKITIATIYWYAKQAGINTISKTTSRVAAATSSMKKSGMDAKGIAENLKKFEGIENVDDIILQAFTNNIPDNNNLVDNIRMHIKHTYNLRRNVITRKIDKLDDTTLNTMFLDAKILFEDLTFDLFCRVIFSNNTPDYNPFTSVLKGEWDGHCRIEQLAKSINSHTGTEEWRERMLMKWLVGIVHAINGGKNELNFILVGGKNTGKTEFFRRLLPPELKDYFAESQLNRGKDDEILMCEKLIIFNDEYGGKNKMDERNEKRLMASDEFSLREPYGKSNITLKRLASLCGTCNERDILDDPTGNRRIIIMEAKGKFNYELYNSIDKLQLLYEVNELWKQGERPILEDNDIIQLENNTDGEFSKTSFEKEMIMQYFLPPTQTNPWDFMTTTQIKLYLENNTKEKININKLGAQLRKLGYNRRSEGGKYGYDIATVTKM